MFRKKKEVTTSTIDIAKTIINRCLRRECKIYLKKLEIMMIIAYGEYLVSTGKRLFDAKICVNEKGIFIKEIREEFASAENFNTIYADEKMFFFLEEKMLRKLVCEYGNKNFKCLDSDQRIKALKEFKRITKSLSDKDIIEVFENIPKPPIDTPILCGASEKAKWIINGCLQKGYHINTFKLEKLLILAYGECLVKTGTKLFDEKIVIWESGPMVREVDQDFRCYAIEFYAPLYEYHLKLDSEEKLIESIIYKYGNKDGFELNENVKLKELVELKNSDGFVSDEDIKSVFEKYIL